MHTYYNTYSLVNRYNCTHSQDYSEAFKLSIALDVPLRCLLDQYKMKKL